MHGKRTFRSRFRLGPSTCEGLNLSKDEVEAHLRALAEAKIAADYPAQFAFLYENLGILDSKASSLLTFNAVGLAVLAVWLESIPRNWFHFSMDLAFLLFIVSCAFCLKIVWLYWASTDDIRSPDRHVRRMLELREVRTIAYRRAWSIAVAALLVTGGAAIVHSAGTFAQAIRGTLHHQTSGTAGAPS